MNTCTDYTNCQTSSCSCSCAAARPIAITNAGRMSLDHALYLLGPFARFIALVVCFALLISLLLGIAVSASVAGQQTQPALILVSNSAQAAELPGILSGGAQYVEANAYINEFGSEPSAAMVYYKNTAYFPVANGAVVTK